MGFVRLCARVAAVSAVVLFGASVRAQAYDAIGASSASSNTNYFLSTTSNLDNASDFWTAAGVGTFTIPSGQRVNSVEAIIGVRGPNGTGPFNFSAVSVWEVHIWSSLSAFAAAPKAGDVLNKSFTTPSNADHVVAYGTDVDGQPTYRVRFNFPGGITGPVSGSTYHFAIRARVSYANGGYVGVLESSNAGMSGVQAGWGWPAPGYVFFSGSLLAPVRKHSGVLAYRVGTGCRADFDCNSVVSIDDLFLYFNAYFQQSPGSDFSGDGVTSIDDLFLYINQYFTGC